MAQDYKVEVQARAIEDDAHRELFCLNFGGHWNKQYKRFFLFLQKRVEKGGDSHWNKVEDVDVYGKEYMKYNCIKIGSTLVRSKLEEAAKLWATMSEESFKDAECSYVDAMDADG
jgi:hypothetical protein